MITSQSHLIYLIYIILLSRSRVAATNTKKMYLKTTHFFSSVCLTQSSTITMFQLAPTMWQKHKNVLWYKYFFFIGSPIRRRSYRKLGQKVKAMVRDISLFLFRILETFLYTIKLDLDLRGGTRRFRSTDFTFGRIQAISNRSFFIIEY